MSSLNLYGYNSKEIDTTYKNVDFFVQFTTNLKKLQIGLGHLGVKDVNP